MKKTIGYSFFGLVAIGWGLIIESACQSPTHRERIIRTDTVYGLTVKGQQGPDQYFAKAILAQIETRKLPKDSSSEKLEWGLDSIIVQVYAPVFDTAKKEYTKDSAWQPIHVYDPHTVWIKYFPAPKHP